LKHGLECFGYDPALCDRSYQQPRSGSWREADGIRRAAPEANSGRNRRTTPVAI